MNEEQQEGQIIPELLEDLECYWCLGYHAIGVVCPFAPYYVEEKKGEESK